MGFSAFDREMMAAPHDIKSLTGCYGGRRGSVGKASGLRPKGREFEPQPGHYVCNLWAGLLNPRSPEQVGQYLL